MANRSTARSIDEYIANFPPETQKMLEELRALIKKTAPGVTERISYAIPTFDLNGRYLVYMAGWKKHISIYPLTPNVIASVGDELTPYRQGRGTARFPLDKPMPVDLIRRIVETRVSEVTAAS